MNVHKLKILNADIETLPGDAHFFGPKIRYLSHKMVQRNPIMVTWSAQVLRVNERPSKMYSDYLTPQEVRDWDDSRIVQSLIDLMQECDLVMAHNADRFDVNVVRGRAWANGLPALGPIRTIDTLKIAKDFGLPHNNLDSLLKAKGIRQKDKTDITWWTDIKDHARSGHDELAAKAIRRMLRYNMNDVRGLSELFTGSLFEHARKLPRLVDSTNSRACLYCGVEGALIKRGRKRTNAFTYQRFHCDPSKGGCGRYPRYKTHDGSNDSDLRTSAGS